MCKKPPFLETVTYIGVLLYAHNMSYDSLDLKQPILPAEDCAALFIREDTLTAFDCT